MTTAHPWVRAARYRMVRVVFGQQHARQIHLAAADVGVDVDAAGHDHTAADIVGLCDRVGVDRRRHDTVRTEVQRSNFSVNTVCGVVDATTVELN